MQHQLSHRIPILKRQIAEFGYQRHVAKDGDYTLIPLTEEDGALLALMAEASFLSLHNEQLIKTVPSNVPGEPAKSEKNQALLEAAEAYFESYFDQVVAGDMVQPDELVEQCVMDASGGMRAGDYFLKSMRSIADGLLAEQQQTRQYNVRGR